MNEIKAIQSLCICVHTHNTHTNTTHSLPALGRSSLSQLSIEADPPPRFTGNSPSWTGDLTQLVWKLPHWGKCRVLRKHREARLPWKNYSQTGNTQEGWLALEIRTRAPALSHQDQPAWTKKALRAPAWPSLPWAS